jgi:hypothetical protein
MVTGEAAIIVAIAYVFRLDFPVLWSLAPLAVILASNLALGRIRSLSGRFPQATPGAAFVLDTLALTVILGLTGVHVGENAAGGRKCIPFDVVSFRRVQLIGDNLDETVWS